MSPYHRKPINHNPPEHLDPTTLQNYFITITCNPQNKNQLANTETSTSILSATNHYNSSNTWHCKQLLLMPDHLHAIIKIQPSNLTKAITSFKRWLTKEKQISWNRSFHERRIRTPQDLQEIYLYIIQNPIRANLCKTPKQWPYSYKIASTTNKLEPSNNPPNP